MDDTLLEQVERLATDRGTEQAFVFEDHTWTRAEVWAEAGHVGRFLCTRGLDPGDRILLALPNGPDFLFGFLGAQRAGLVPVPLAPGSGPDRIADIAELARARSALLTDDLRERVLSRCGDRMRRRDVSLFTPGDATGSSSPTALPGAGPGDLCFIQYTSGSTAEPRGVGVTHRNLSANLLSLTLGMEITPADALVSWLPLHHDMGLILMALVPFSLGARLVLLESRLGSGETWLRAIERARGTLTAAPDFSYRYVCRHVAADARFDLSSLRLALNAAEPVRASTLRAFEDRFGLHDVMVAGYGLAEATVGVSTWPSGTPARVDAHGCVSVGPPLPGVSVRIAPHPAVDPGPERQGEIEVSGVAATQGYVDNPEATARLLAPDGAVRTGDLGYLDGDGFLYVTGRAKEMIKYAGRTIAPAEVEEVVDRVAGIRRSAAVGIDRGGAEGEALVVFAELESDAEREAGPADRRALSREIVRAFIDRFGFRPGRVLLVAPRSLPRTPNGKIRRGELRERYLEGWGSLPKPN
ncbi:MAG: AMP-binding protein [Deltaproteobacteria bacterium]|nr:AMP-binding protein [Deltaproteobacteria bacterium]